MTVDEVNRSSRLNWFALQVRSNCERMVADGVRHKGFEDFLPLYQERRRWSDRIKTIEAPLFPGYVFCRLDPGLRLPVLTIPGALRFVAFGKSPAPIEDAEIAAIQNVVRSGFTAEPWPYLDKGRLVRFDDGPLAGLEGILVESRKKDRVVVSVTLLKRSVAVEIGRDWVTPLGSDRRPVVIRYAV